MMSSSKEAKDVSIQRCAGTRRICKRGISPFAGPPACKRLLRSRWAEGSRATLAVGILVAKQHRETL